MSYIDFKNKVLGSQVKTSDSFQQFKDKALGNETVKTEIPTFKTVEEAKKYAEENNIKINSAQYEKASQNLESAKKTLKSNLTGTDSKGNTYKGLTDFEVKTLEELDYQYPNSTADILSGKNYSFIDDYIKLQRAEKSGKYSDKTGKSYTTPPTLMQYITDVKLAESYKNPTTTALDQTLVKPFLSSAGKATNELFEDYSRRTSINSANKILEGINYYELWKLNEDVANGNAKRFEVLSNNSYQKLFNYNSKTKTSFFGLSNENSNRLNEILSEIRNGTYKGTASELRKEIEEISTWENNRSKTSQNLSNYVEDVQRQNNAMYEDKPGELDLNDISESISVVGNMFPTIALGQAIGANSTVQAAPELLKNIAALSPLYITANQSGYEQARKEGATPEEASTYAMGTGAVEVLTEMIGGTSTNALLGAGDTLMSNFGSKFIRKITNDWVKLGVIAIKDVLEEGVEEVIAAWIEPYIKKLTYDNTAGFKSWEEVWDATSEAFTSSILPTLMLFGTNTARVGKDAVIQQFEDEILEGDIKKFEKKVNKIIKELEKTTVVPESVQNQKKAASQEAKNAINGLPSLTEEQAKQVRDLQKNLKSSSNIQGLEDYTEQDIKDIVRDHIESLTDEIKIKGIALNGSRLRGDSKSTSDLDVVVEYDGDVSEDTLFNILNEEPLKIEGITVDINPITKGKSGTLEEYMKKSKEYDSNLTLKEEEREYGISTLHNAILGQLDTREILEEEQRILKEEFGEDALDMDWQDEVDEETRDKAIGIVYDRFVNSDKGRKFIANYNKTMESNVDINQDNDYNMVKEPSSKYSPINKTGWSVSNNGDILHNGKAVEVPYNLIPYIQAEPSKGAYLQYTDSEYFYELPLEVMDRAIADISGYAAQLLEKKEKLGSMYSVDKLYYFEIIDGTPNFRIIDILTIGVDVNVAGVIREDIDTDKQNTKRGRQLQNGDIGETRQQGESETNARLDRGKPKGNNKRSVEGINENKENIVKNSKQGSFSLPKNVKEIKNMNEFLRNAIPLETDKYWKQRLKDAQSAEQRKLGRYTSLRSPLQEKRYIVQQYLDYKNNLDLREPEAEYDSTAVDSQGNKLSKEQQEFFSDVSEEMEDANGNLKVLYHETDLDSNFTIFDLGIKKHSSGDYQFPLGIFLKDTPKSIGLGKGTKQIPLYANITNPLVVDNREQLEGFLSKNEEYRKLVRKVESIDKEYHDRFEKDEKEFYRLWEESSKEKDANKKNELNRRIKEKLNRDDFFAEWRREKNKYGNKAREIATSYLKSFGYDGVIMENDEGSFGRRIKTYVAFEPNQVKSIDNKTPTSNPDILKEQEAEYGSYRVVRTLNEEVLKKLSKELGESSTYLDANIGKTEKSAKNFIAFNTNIVKKYMEEKGISFPKKYKSVEYSKLFTDRLRQFAKENDLTVKKLANDEKLLNQFLAMWTDEIVTTSGNITDKGKQYLEENQKEWKRYFEYAKDTGEIPSVLRVFDREFDYVKNGITEIEDDSDDWSNRNKIINSKEFQEYLDEKIKGLFDENVYNPEDVMEEAISNHGTTDDYSVGAYMTLDGQLLDFNYDGFRDDHRGISVYDMGMQDFMNYGAIRMQPESNGFELAVEPTDAQYDRLYDYLENYVKRYGDGDINIDIDFLGKGKYDSATYNIDTSASQIINDIKYYFENGKFPDKSKYGKFLYEQEAQYEGQTKMDLDKIAPQVVESKNDYSDGKPIVQAQRYWNGFQEQGYIDITGKEVRNIQDVADLSQIFRNPLYETFRIIYMKNNRIVGMEAITSRVAGKVRFKFDKKVQTKMQDRMNRLGADGYYLVHNHPSGNAIASQQDIETTEKIESEMAGFRGHIIVDHGTYASIVKGLNGHMVALNDGKVDSSKSYSGSEFQSNLPSYKVPWNNLKVSSSKDIAELGYHVKNSDTYSTLILTDPRLNVNAIIDLPNSFLNMSRNQVEGYIKNISKKYGASKAFIGTNNQEAYNKAKELRNTMDVVRYNSPFEEATGLTDRFTRKADVFNDKEVISKRLSEEEENYETDEQRAERVRKYIEETQRSIGTLGAKANRKDIVNRIMNDYGITKQGNSKELNKVSKAIQDDIKNGTLTDSKIQKYAEDLLDDLSVTVDDYYNANKELKELIRRTKLYVSDAVKNGFGDWNDFRKQNIGTLRVTNDSSAIPVDTFYQELSSEYGEDFFPSDIVNPSDQLERITEVAKQIKKIDMTLKDNIKENFGDDARKEIVNALVENFKNLRETSKAKMNLKTDSSLEMPDVKERSFTKTAQKNDMVKTFLEDDIENLTYVVKSNKKSVGTANDRLETQGYKNSLDYFESVMKSGKLPTAEDMTLGERLIQESLKKGDFDKAKELISDVAIMGTELGQAVQAMSLISRLSPEGQFTYLERAVNRINEKEREKRKPTKKKGLNKVLDDGKVGDTDIKITDEMKRDILSASTPEELETAVTRVKEQIAAQLPVTWQDKLMEWRYLSMLGNPKTHIRNIVGNLMMMPQYEIKNLLQRSLETMFSANLEEKTKTFEKATDFVKNFAESMLDENRDALAGSGYTNIQSELRSMRKVFKAKVLQELNKFSTNSLEFEDFIFKKNVFVKSLAEYLTANGIKTEQDIKKNAEIVQKGINYSVEEAKKATFNQYNAVASAISKLENSNDLAKVLVGGLAPFKRTPMNIVKTAWQYSPAGLAETLLKQTINLRNGFITPNEYIERISQGLTGTGTFALGYLLASLGVLSGSMGGKKKDKYEESIGIQKPYSIKAGDKSFDVSWLSPFAVPILMGAEMYSLRDENKDKVVTLDNIIETVEKMMNPISEMTMLQTFNDALINYGGDNDVAGLAGIADTVLRSYISQAFPTLGSQINKIIDPTIRTTVASKNSEFKSGEKILRQNANKIPGLSYLLEPSLDIWGNVRKRSDNVILRTLDSLVNPATITKDTSTSVDNEIISLYEKDGNADVIPSTPSNYFTANSVQYDLSAREYTEYKMTFGQTSYNNLEQLFASQDYKEMSNEEKEKSIKRVYTGAKEEAQYEYMTNKYGYEEGLKKLLDEKEYQKFNKIHDELGYNYSEYIKLKNARTISGTTKKSEISSMMKVMPTLSQSDAEKLYRIFNGKL